jgi:diguanylate cyclase (GGDEF)-like protein/PAS domain S-box-containing protein
MRIQAEANLSALIESTEDLIWSVDPRLRLITFNRAFKEHFEKNFGGPVAPGMGMRELLPAARVVYWFPLYERVLKGEKIRAEITLVDGCILDLSFSPIVVDGQITGISIFGKDITARKQAEDAFKKTEANLSALIESTHDLIWAVDLDYRLITFNQALQRNIEEDYQIQLAPGMRFHEVLTPERAALWPPFYARVLAEGPFRIEYTRIDGGSMELFFNPILIDGKTTGISIFGKDITEQKLAEKHLRESRDFLSEAQRIGNLGCFVLDFTSGFWISTPQLDKLFGIGSDYERSVAGWAELVHAEDRASMTAYFENEVWGAGEDFDKEYRIVRVSDGAERWVHGMGRLEFDAQGRPAKMRGTIRDITGHKQAEIAVEERERLFRAITESSPMAIILSPGPWERVQYLNSAFTRIFGYTQEEVSCVADWWPLAYPDAEYRLSIQNEWKSRVELMCNQETLLDPIETEVNCKDGSRKIIQWGLVNIDQRHLVFGLDLTESRAAERKIRESEARFRRFFEENSSVMLMLEPSDGEIVAANQAACAFYGYPKEQFVGMHTWQINNPPPEQLARDREITLGSKCSIFNYRNRRSDGEERDVEVYSSPIVLDGRTLLYAIVHDVTDRKQAERLLMESEQRYRATFEEAPMGIVHAAPDGRFLRCNERFAEIIGYAREEVCSLSYQKITLPEDLADATQVRERLLHEESATIRAEKQYIRKDGSLVWVRVSLTARRDREGILQYFIVVVENIQARKESEAQLATAAEALRKSEERYRTAFQTSIDSININRLSDGLYVDCNQAFLGILGYEREEVIGKSSLDLNIWADARDRMAMVEMVRQNSHCRGLEVQFRKKNGELIWGEMSASLIEIDGTECVLSVVRDVSHMKVAETTIRNLAFYDSLTGLPNRRFLTEKLYQVQSAARTDHSQALLFVELDHFKKLNETLSHSTGDLLLKEIAQRIRACVGESDMVCRLGGDEFAVMLGELSESVEEAAAQARDVGERIRTSIGLPCVLDGRECITTASIGVTVFGADPPSIDELLQEADIALYQAKLAGRNAMRFFSPALQSAVNARATLEEDMRQAIKGKQFLLYYQPQVTRGRVIGAEALIRWRHPKNGMVPPDAFIPLAEETGLILPVGDWVLEAACRQIAAWAGQKSTAHLTISVNISALQFRQPGFIETVLKALESTDANPRKLKLELTESMLVENIEDVISKMTVLKEHGLSFSLDDFGTGYSSLAYLKRLPLDQLKIDRAFVRDMLVDVTSGAIAHTVISLGRAMGLSVVAEGVETEEQRGYLAGLNCHSYQGTLFSPPLPVDEFEKLI